MIFGSLSFLSPWLLLALAGLPVLWWLLRLTPPAPRRQSFPAIRLLFDLVPPEETPQRTPPWLIALRLLLAALIILGFAEPLLNAQGELAGRKALMLVVEQRGPTMFVRIAVMKALNRHVERVFNPERKDTDDAEKWFEEHDPEGAAFEYEVLE